MKCWVIIFSHRYGADAWPVFSDRKPTKRQIIKSIDWEGDTRDDEFLEIRGPWEVPKEGEKT
jgi:hypothetical protein